MWNAYRDACPERSIRFADAIENGTSCPFVFHYSFFTIHCSLYFLGAVAYEKPRIAACAANAGRVRETGSRREMPAGAPRPEEIGSGHCPPGAPRNYSRFTLWSCRALSLLVLDLVPDVKFHGARGANARGSTIGRGKKRSCVAYLPSPYGSPPRAPSLLILSSLKCAPLSFRVLWAKPSVSLSFHVAACVCSRYDAFFTIHSSPFTVHSIPWEQ